MKAFILLIPLLLLGILFLIGVWLGNQFSQVRNIRCFYCKKKIGKDYDEKDGSRYRDLKDDLLWSHTKCIPKEKLNTWKRTK